MGFTPQKTPNLFKGSALGDLIDRAQDCYAGDGSCDHETLLAVQKKHEHEVAHKQPVQVHHVKTAEPGLKDMDDQIALLEKRLAAAKEAKAMKQRIAKINALKEQLAKSQDTATSTPPGPTVHVLTDKEKAAIQLAKLQEELKKVQNYILLI